MAVDRTFYDFDDAVTLAQLATLIDGSILRGAPDQLIRDIAPLHDAASGVLSYVVNTKALTGHIIPEDAIIIATESCGKTLPESVSVIIVNSPRLAFANAARRLVTQKNNVDNHMVPSAVASDTQIHPSVHISPRATVMRGVAIGAGSIIEAGAVIYPYVTIGSDCRIYANSSIACAHIGNEVVIRNGAVIGSAGFGLESNADSIVKISQLGITRIGDGCDIGSNTTIDRGSLDDTILGKMVMLDNLCHIAHNCVIGDNCMIAAQVGMAGSVTLGRNVIVGGQAGISGHLTIGEGAVIMGRSGVTKDVPTKTTVVGFPAEPSGEYWRKLAGLRQLLKQSQEKK